MADLQEVDFDELARSFKARYQRVEPKPVGAGTYGEVYKARCISSGGFVALKEMKNTNEEEGIPSTALREVALLKQLRHANVVGLLDVFCSPKKVILVFEFVDQDLKKYMRSRNCKLDPSTIKSLTHQLCTGIEYCHANSVLHRDLKPQNLLVDGQLRLKLADFGLARAFMLPVGRLTHEVVTVWYRPLEILLGGKLYSTPVDMWGVGCIFAELATGNPLFCGDSEIDTIFKICQKLGTPTAEAWPGLSDMPDFKPTFPKWKAKGWENIRNTKAQLGPVGIDLLDKLMLYDPKLRMSARSALKHRYFADVELPDTR